MRFRSITTFAFLLLYVITLTGCLITPDRVTKARVEVNPAPEMRGAGHDMKSSHEFRFSGNINEGPSKIAQVSGIYSEWPVGCRTKACQEQIQTVAPSNKVDLDYDIDYAILTGSVEFLWKKGLYLLDIGIGVNNGLYDFISMGLHTSHFEMGLSAGLWANRRKCEYEGYLYVSKLNQIIENVGDEDYWAGAWLLGLYMGFYFGDFGFEVSSSIYDVDLGYEYFSRVPWIATTYVTANFRLSDRWTTRMGTVLLQGSGLEGMYWSVLAGFSYSL